MEQYNFFADLLNKYSQLTPWVQAVLGIGFCAVPLGLAYFVKETVAVVVGPRTSKPKPEKEEWHDKYYRGETEQKLEASKAR